MQNYSPYLHGCLGALPLSKIILQGYQSWLRVHLRWSSWATLRIKKGILCIFLPHDVMSHLQMSLFMRMFPSSRHLPLFLPPLSATTHASLDPLLVPITPSSQSESSPPTMPASPSSEILESSSTASPKPSRTILPHVSESLTSTLVPPLSSLDLPIALRKGTHHYTQHPIGHHVLSVCLSSSYRVFALSVLSGSIPKTYSEALQVPELKAAMDAEYATFLQREMWQLVPCPSDVNVVSCKWVYSLK